MGFRARLAAMIVKETLQLRRDRLTFAMMFGMPIMQLMLFGYAINNDPKGLPAAILSADHSAITRSIVAALGNTGYFNFVRTAGSEQEADALLQRGEVQFVVTLPSDMTRRLVRRERTQIAIEADAALASVQRGVIMKHLKVDLPVEQARANLWLAKELVIEGKHKEAQTALREATDALDELIRDSVGLRMVSDVPLAAFLGQIFGRAGVVLTGDRRASRHHATVHSAPASTSVSV